MINSILVPIDSSDNSGRAVLYASGLAAKFGASVLFLHVLDKLPARKELKRYLHSLEANTNPPEGEIESIRNALSKSGEDEAKRILEHAVRTARDKGVGRVNTAIDDGDPAAEILRYLDTGEFNLVVMGRRGLGGVKGLLMGSLSHKISNMANCTVVTVK
jgi:nucleotide-binding universal stress UspA family protein